MNKVNTDKFTEAIVKTIEDDYCNGSLKNRILRSLSDNCYKSLWKDTIWGVIVFNPQNPLITPFKLTINK